MKKALKKNIDGVAPFSPAKQIAGMPLSRWKLLVDENAPEKKAEPKEAQTGVQRIGREEMGRMCAALRNDLVDWDRRKAQRKVYSFVRRNLKRLHPEDAFELLNEVAKLDCSRMHAERGERENFKMHRKAVGLADRLGRKEGLEESGTIAITVVCGEANRHTAYNYRKTAYTVFLSRCIAGTRPIAPWVASTAERPSGDCIIACRQEMAGVLRDGTGGMDAGHKSSLTRLGTKIGMAIIVSAAAIGFAGKIVVDALAGESSLAYVGVAAVFGVMANIYAHWVKNARKGTKGALDALSVAGLVDRLKTYRVSEGEVEAI